MAKSLTLADAGDNLAQRVSNVEFLVDMLCDELEWSKKGRKSEHEVLKQARAVLSGIRWRLAK